MYKPICMYVWMCEEIRRETMHGRVDSDFRGLVLSVRFGSVSSSVHIVVRIVAQFAIVTLTIRYLYRRVKQIITLNLAT